MSSAGLSWIGKGLPPIYRDGEEYFLLGHEAALYLVRNRCPHRGGPLKLGYINAAAQLVCPQHSTAFALSWLLAQSSTICLGEAGQSP